MKSRGKNINKLSKKGNSFILPKSNPLLLTIYPTVKSLVVPLSVLKIIETLDKIINQSLHCINRDLLRNVLALKHKRVTYHLPNMLTPGLEPMTIYLLRWQIKLRRLIASAINLTRETISLLKDELRDKQVTINNLIDIVKNVTVNENKYTRNKEQTNICSKGDDDVVVKLLVIDELHHRFQKLKYQPLSSTDTPTTSVNVNEDRAEQNRAELELTNNVKDKNIKDQKNESSKISITIYCDQSDNDNNTPPDINNNIVVLGDSIPKGINNSEFEYST